MRKERVNVNATCAVHGARSTAFRLRTLALDQLEASIACEGVWPLVRVRILWCARLGCGQVADSAIRPGHRTSSLYVHLPLCDEIVGEASSVQSAAVSIYGVGDDLDHVATWIQRELEQHVDEIVRLDCQAL